MKTRKEIRKEFNRELDGIKVLDQDQADNLKSLLDVAFDMPQEDIKSFFKGEIYDGVDIIESKLDSFGCEFCFKNGCHETRGHEKALFKEFLKGLGL